MINWEELFKIYVVGTIPLLTIITLEIKDKIIYRKKDTVHVSNLLKAICFFSCFVSLFGAITNGLDYYHYSEGDLWFVVLMMVCYTSLVVILCIIYNEKIVYSRNGNQIILFQKFRKKIICVDDITRFYCGIEYLDIYLGEKRIRYGNNFLSGADDFEAFLKENQKGNKTGNNMKRYKTRDKKQSR